MRKPVVGIIGNSHLINDEYAVQGAGEINIQAIAQVADAVPLIVPALPLVTTAELIGACDGFLFTGGRPNVHPRFYGEEPTEAHGAFDEGRDMLTLPLIRECVAHGVPVLGVCRGFQEFNVAFGGSLHPEIRDLPGRMNHRMPPDGSLEEKFAHRHTIKLTPRGRFSEIFGTSEVMVNSLHGQGLKTPGERIVIEGHAPDGTPEALHVDGAEGYALAVQWHPEWRAADDPVSRPLFESFGAALRGKG